MKVKWVVLFFVMVVLFSALAQERLIKSLKFKDAEIRVVLQAISQKATREDKKVNILVAPDIKGLVTVDLENVDWLTALEAVLKTYDYGYEWVGKNIILVDTLENLAEKRKKAQEAKVAEPLDTRVFTLNFAKVQDLQPTVQKMLTAKGKLTVDIRTNTLVITDTQSNLTVLEEALKVLDEITPQVLIEAKILETDLDVTNKLGIKWNISATAAGTKRPTTWPFTEVSEHKYLDSDAFPDAASTNFTFGTLNASSLSATLDIIFSDTDTKILSMPKITTIDNNTATIDVVTEDPIPNYTYNSETGSWEITGYEWVKYGVSLEVTPQINKEGFVTLSIVPRVSDKKEDKSFISASGATALIPILSTQTTSTKVMVKDGETLVIGGLLRDKTIDTINKIPILGDIPILGYFFKHKNKTVEKRNLLIFITPTVVTPEREKAEK